MVLSDDDICFRFVLLIFYFNRCAERFLDRRSACLLSNYLAGGEFWVLPDDFVVQLPASGESQLSDFEVSIREKKSYSRESSGLNICK